MKKVLSVILSLTIVLTCLLFSGLTVSAAADHTGSSFLVYGNTFAELPLESRVMTDNGDGTYSYSYHIEKSQVITVFFKELKADGSTRDYKADFFLPYCFTTNTEQDIVMTLNPDKSPNLTIDGKDIRPLYGSYFRMYAIFGGQEQFGMEDGLMTEDENGVWSVTYHDVQPCDAVFDAQTVSSQTILGFYGYNTFPAKITDVCDVTVYFQPDFSDGSPNYYSHSCKVWAEGEHLTANPHIILDNVRFDYGGMPSVKVSDNVYYTVAQNVSSDEQYYWTAVFETDTAGGEFYVDWANGFQPLKISENTEIDAKLYPIYWNTNGVVINSPYKYTNVKLTLDASNLDYVTKEGAKFRYELIDMVKDVNMDGAYTIGDATELQRALAEYIELTDNQQIAADVNGDGIINIADVTELQRFLVKN